MNVCRGLTLKFSITLCVPSFSVTVLQAAVDKGSGTVVKALAPAAGWP